MSYIEGALHYTQTLILVRSCDFCWECKLNMPLFWRLLVEPILTWLYTIPNNSKIYNFKITNTHSMSKYSMLYNKYDESVRICIQAFPQ